MEEEEEDIGDDENDVSVCGEAVEEVEKEEDEEEGQVGG